MPDKSWLQSQRHSKATGAHPPRGCALYTEMDDSVKHGKHGTQQGAREETEMSREDGDARVAMKVRQLWRLLS